MGSDWTKMRTDLYRDPKVCLMADLLMEPSGPLAQFVSQMCQRHMTVTRNVTRNATVGALVSVWGVMRHRGKRRDNDLVCTGVTVSVIDDISDMPGFGDAMAGAGWLVETETGIEFPRFFDDYNVEPGASERGGSAERMRRYRERQKSIGDGKSDASRDATVTRREEKKREEKKDLQREVLPDWLPAEKWQDFVDHRKAIRKPMTDKARERMLRHLSDLKARGHDVLALIDTAIRSGWQDVYEPKPAGQFNSPAVPRPPRKEVEL